MSTVFLPADFIILYAMDADEALRTHLTLKLPLLLVGGWTTDL